MVKVAGAISKSGEVMKSMNDLLKIGAMQEGMRNLAREMMRAGLIEEMVDDTMEGVGAALSLFLLSWASAALMLLKWCCERNANSSRVGGQSTARLSSGACEGKAGARGSVRRGCR